MSLCNSGYFGSVVKNADAGEEKPEIGVRDLETEKVS